MIDHQPIGTLPLCNSTKLNYFYSTNSFVSTYKELVSFIEQRYDSNSIIFKAMKDKGEFQLPQELKEKTYTAIMHVMFKKNNIKAFALIFNEMHNIGKIIFQPRKRKIDLTKHCWANMLFDYNFAIKELIVYEKICRCKRANACWYTD